MRLNKNRLSLYFCWLVLLGYFILTIAAGKWNRHTVIKSDTAGYYAYLSSVFVYHDLLHCQFYPQVDSVYDVGNGVVYYAVQQNHETGNFYFKYNYGVALFEAPFFFVAHAFALATNLFPADGYSTPYQLSVALSAVLFSFLALLLLRKFLLKYFSDVVVTLTLLIIACGTNFFAQVITQPGLSHIYLFFLYSTILFGTQKFYSTEQWKYLVVLSIALGWCLITRSTDAFVFFIPLCWKLTELKSWRSVLLAIQKKQKANFRSGIHH